MGSGARLLSAGEAFGRSLTGTSFLITVQPPGPVITYQRVTASWDYVNDLTNVTPEDLCEDRNPPDPTPGPSRPDLGNYTHTSRFTLVTQCFIRDFSPGYAWRLVLNAGDGDEALLPFDLTANGYPWQAFSDYLPAFPYAKNRIQCYASIPASAILPRSTGQGGATQDYNPSAGVQGWAHQLNIWQWDGVTLPTAFGRPLAVDIPVQAPGSITGFSSSFPNWTATAPGHGLLCGSAIRIFDTDTPPNELTVRIHNVTADTFQWFQPDYGSWTGLAVAQWEPAYNVVIAQTTQC